MKESNRSNVDLTNPKDIVSFSIVWKTIVAVSIAHWAHVTYNLWFFEYSNLDKWWKIASWYILNRNISAASLCSQCSPGWQGCVRFPRKTTAPDRHGGRPTGLGKLCVNGKSKWIAFQENHWPGHFSAGLMLCHLQSTFVDLQRFLYNWLKIDPWLVEKMWVRKKHLSLELGVWRGSLGDGGVLIWSPPLTSLVSLKWFWTTILPYDPFMISNWDGDSLGELPWWRWGASRGVAGVHAEKRDPLLWLSWAWLVFTSTWWWWCWTANKCFYQSTRTILREVTLEETLLFLENRNLDNRAANYLLAGNTLPHYINSRPLQEDQLKLITATLSHRPKFIFKKKEKRLKQNQMY